MASRNLNFISHSGNLRILQASTLVAVLGCVALGSATLTRMGGQTATIADTLASASFSAVPSAAPAAVKPKAISENAAVSAAVGTMSDTVRYYEQSTGRAFSVSLSTLRTDILSDQKLPGFIRSYWIPKTQRVLSAFQRPSGVEYAYYDYTTKESSTVGTDFSGIAISPDGRRLVRLTHTGADAYSLDISAIDGSAPAIVLSTRIEEPRVSWKDNSTVALTSRRTEKMGRDLSLVDEKGAFTVLLTGKENLETLWSPDGTYLLYSYFVPEKGISLWLRSAATGQEIDLGVETSAKKCAWHSLGLVVTCGVPMKKSLARDVSSDETATIDDIVTFDFDNTVVRQVYSGANSSLIGVTEPLLSSSDSYFVFTNIFDRRLYMLPL